MNDPKDEPAQVNVEPLPRMTREMCREIEGQLAVLSVVTVKDQQFNFRVFPDEADAVIRDWAGNGRDSTAALAFWAQSIEGRGFIGKWVFPTAMIAQIRQYSEDELAELQARAKAAQALRPNRG